MPQLQLYKDGQLTRREAAEAEAASLEAEGWIPVFTQDPRVAAYYETFLERLAAGMAPRAEPLALRAELERNHALSFPPELCRLLDHRDRHQLCWPSVGEWRVWSSDGWAPDPAGNRFEQLVRCEQENVLSTALMEHLAWLVPVGTAGNGDVYLAALDPATPENTVVALYDHERGSLSHLVADSLSSLAWANRCLELAEEGEAAAVLAAELAPVQRRVHLGWHYEALLERSGVQPSFEGERAHDKSPLLWHASYWIKLLFSCDHRTPSAVEWYRQTARLQASLGAQLEAFLAGPLQRTPPWALYWLWRSFWLKEDAVLERVLPLCREHRSPVVVDAAALLERARAGEPRLGHLEDLLAYRESFLASLDPAAAPSGVRSLAELGLGEAMLRRFEERRASELEALRAEKARDRWRVTLVRVGELMPALRAIREVAEVGLKEARAILETRPAGTVLRGVTRKAAEAAAERLREAGIEVEVGPEVDRPSREP